MASVHFVRNVGLNDAATGAQTLTDDEPTAASFLDHVFLTGNVYASRSADGGATWSFVDPVTSFPLSAAGTILCCDQVTLHEPSRNLWLWLMQHRTVPAGSNIFRLAASTSGQPGPWFFWDFSPSQFDPAWTPDVMFDFPDMAASSNHLYITFNVYRGNSWLAAIVFKMPLDGIVSQFLPYEYLKITTHGSLRLTRGATSEMLFGSHGGAGNPVRVFRWPDAPGSSMSSFDVWASAWTGSFLRGSYSSPGPGGVEWLWKLDSRITGAWIVGSQAGFLWAALPRPAQGRPQPYVKALVVDINTRTAVAEPDLWNPDFAFAYPAACPNANGVVGVSVCYGGGGTSHPKHVVGFLDGNQWVLGITSESTHGPSPFTPVWGDYLSCVQHHPTTTEWVATGFTMQGGSALYNIEPQFTRFAVGP
jgi:hypothetical protein